MAKITPKSARRSLAVLEENRDKIVTVLQGAVRMQRANGRQIAQLERERERLRKHKLSSVKTLVEIEFKISDLKAYLNHPSISGRDDGIRHINGGSSPPGEL